MAEGSGHLQTLVEAFDKTHKYVQDMGGQVGAKKVMHLQLMPEVQAMAEQNQMEEVARQGAREEPLS